MSEDHAAVLGLATATIVMTVLDQCKTLALNKEATTEAAEMIASVFVNRVSQAIAKGRHKFISVPDPRPTAEPSMERKIT